MVAIAAGTAAHRAAEHEHLRALAAQADAELLLVELDRQRLTALAGSRLLEAGALPEALRAQVRTRLDLNRMRGLHHAAVTRRVGQALLARGIPFLTLKGHMLAEDLHGDLGLRQSSDIDVLVPKAVLHEATEALKPMGYVLHERPGERDLPDLHFQMVDPGGGLPMVEVHWRIHWLDGGFAAAMLARSDVREGRRRPTPADELASLLIYFARDGFVGLRLLADIAAWYDRHGTEGHGRVLDEVAAAHPELRQLLAAALRVSEPVTGVPAAALMTPVQPWRRAVLATRLANWRVAGEHDQIVAETTLVNLLLAPVPNLPELLRRHLLISGERVMDYYDLPPGAVVRRGGLRAAHLLKLLLRYAFALVKAGRTLTPTTARP